MAVLHGIQNYVVHTRLRRQPDFLEEIAFLLQLLLLWSIVTGEPLIFLIIVVHVLGGDGAAKDTPRQLIIFIVLTPRLREKEANTYVAVIFFELKPASSSSSFVCSRCSSRCSAALEVSLGFSLLLE